MEITVSHTRTRCHHSWIPGLTNEYLELCIQSKSKILTLSDAEVSVLSRCQVDAVNSASLRPLQQSKLTKTCWLNMRGCRKKATKQRFFSVLSQSDATLMLFFHTQQSLQGHHGFITLCLLFFQQPFWCLSVDSLTQQCCFLHKVFKYPSACFYFSQNFQKFTCSVFFLGLLFFTTV